MTDHFSDADIEEIAWGLAMQSHDEGMTRMTLDPSLEQTILNTCCIAAVRKMIDRLGTDKFNLVYREMSSVPAPLQRIADEYLDGDMSEGTARELFEQADVMLRQYFDGRGEGYEEPDVLPRFVPALGSYVLTEILEPQSLAFWKNYLTETLGDDPETRASVEVMLADAVNNPLKILDLRNLADSLAERAMHGRYMKIMLDCGDADPTRFTLADAKWNALEESFARVGLYPPGSYENIEKDEWMAEQLTDEGYAVNLAEYRTAFGSLIL